MMPTELMVISHRQRARAASAPYVALTKRHAQSSNLLKPDTEHAEGLVRNVGRTHQMNVVSVSKHQHTAVDERSLNLLQARLDAKREEERAKRVALLGAVSGEHGGDRTICRAHEEATSARVEGGHQWNQGWKGAQQLGQECRASHGVERVPTVHPVDCARGTCRLEPLQVSAHREDDLLHTTLNVDAELVVRKVRREVGAELVAHGPARDAAQHLADGDGTHSTT